MNYVQKFSNYCDIIIASKKIEIPEKQLAQPVRRQQFEDSCKLMEYNLDKDFVKKANEVEEQAHKEGSDLTLEDLKQMGQIGQTQIKQFIEKAKENFYGY